MSGIRTSAIWQREDATDSKWYAFGDGLEAKFTPTNNWKKYESIGTKFRTGEAAGRFTGSFSITTILDYGNHHILGLAFDEDGKSGNEYTYRKVDGKRPPSFTVRTAIVNKNFGGGDDVTRTYTGCVVDSMDFSQDTGGPNIKVTMSGMYVDQSEDYTGLNNTEFIPITADKIEWNCLRIDDVEDDPIANVETIKFGVKNNIEMLYGTCSRFAKGYFEKNTTFTVSATIYSDRPDWMRRVYSGGITPESLDDDRKPRCKNLEPIEYMYITSGVKTECTPSDATNNCVITLKNTYVDSVAYDAKPNTKMVDSPTMSPRELSIKITTNQEPDEL